MKTTLTRLAGLACVLGGALALGAGCDSEKGPAEKAGEKVDQAAQNVKDAVSAARDPARRPAGPPTRCAIPASKTSGPIAAQG